MAFTFKSFLARPGRLRGRSRAWGAIASLAALQNQVDDSVLASCSAARASRRRPWEAVFHLNEAALTLLRVGRRKEAERLLLRALRPALRSDAGDIVVTICLLAPSVIDARLSARRISDWCRAYTRASRCFGGEATPTATEALGRARGATGGRRAKSRHAAGWMPQLRHLWCRAVSRVSAREFAAILEFGEVP